jgi:TolB protein
MRATFSAAICALAMASLVPLASAGPTDKKKSGGDYVEIAGTGQSLYRIAIPPIITHGGWKKSKVKIMRKVLSNDLELFGLFKTLNPKGFLANLKAEGTSIRPKDWINVGAQAVVKARAWRMGRLIEVHWFLYDVSKGTTPVLKKVYKGRNIRRLAHRFGNDIVYYFTKRKGVFLTRIAFASGSRKSGWSQIYVVDFDGYGRRRISPYGRQNILPSWSPRGRITYTGFLWQNPDLYIKRGKRAYRLSRQPGLNIGAKWSPRGNEIALTMSRNGNAEIYVIASNGKIKRRLTSDPGIDASPSWAPDGSQIAFVSNRGGSPQIYVMSASGGAAKRLTFKGSYNQEPAWCPNPGTPLVAFTGRDDKGNYDIFTVNVKTGDVKRLTQGQGSNKSPSWSPDGRLIVFSSSRGGLWVMNPQGLNQRRIFRGAAHTPSWSFY